jgi:hypothetical protein
MSEYKSFSLKKTFKRLNGIKMETLLYLNSRDAVYNSVEKTYTFPKVSIQNIKTIRLLYFNIPFGWYTVTDTTNSFSFGMEGRLAPQRIPAPSAVGLPKVAQEIPPPTFKFTIPVGWKYAGAIASEIEKNMNRISIYQKYNVKFENDRFCIISNNDLPFVIRSEGTTIWKQIGMEEHKDAQSRIIEGRSVCFFPNKSSLMASEIQIRLPELVQIYESSGIGDLCSVIDATGLFPVYRHEPSRECTVGTDLPTLTSTVNGMKVKLVDDNGIGIQFGEGIHFSIMFKIGISG